jgi:ketosteroid isomerase-like protein
MSQENVELVRRALERFARHESVSEFIAEDVEYVNPSYAVEPGTRFGRDALVSVRDTYPDFQFHIERIIDAGDEDVVVLGHYTASGGVSGVPLTGTHAHIWTIRDGLVVRFQWFQSHREALETAGVSVDSA